MLMKRIIVLPCLMLFFASILAQNTSKGDSHSTNQNMIIRIDGSQNVWVKGDNDPSTGTNTPALGNENVSFTTTSEGIYITILSGSNKIKLLALTGQLLLDGDLTQGRFFIPTRKGIYFLKINNKNYKVICK
jgi:hypothetical protein